MENYFEDENNLFFEKLYCLFIHIFWKSLCNLQIFYHSVFRLIHSIGIFFFTGGKCVDLVVFF